jgi:hypothetical protein
MEADMTIDWREGLRAVVIGLISIAALTAAFIGLWILFVVPLARADDRQMVCLTEYFRICGQPQSAADVRACIVAHKSSFTASCLSLAKEVEDVHHGR